MSDDDNGDDNVTHLEFGQPPRKSELRNPDGKPETKRKQPQIPVLKPATVDPAALIEKPDQRAIACVNLRMAGAQFVEIANELGYATPKAAEVAYVSALSTMYPVESWENLRQIEALRAETLFRQALANAQATHYVDLNDPDHLIPNTEQARWHDQAIKALQLHAVITGAKAPTRVEVSASTQELHQMVNDILTRQGGEEILEADIFDIETPELTEGPEDRE